MDDRTGVSRRNVVGAMGALLIAVSGSATGERPTAVHGAGSTSLAEVVGESYVAPSKTELPVPAAAPAVGITDDGLYRYPSDSDRWEAVEEWATDDPSPESGGGSGSMSDDTRVVSPGDDLQDAVDGLREGGTLVLANGRHPVSEPITLPSNVTVSGRSFDGSILVADGTEAVVESHDEHYVQVRNLKIDGRNAADGIRFSNAESQPSHHLLEDVHAVNCRRGVVFDDIEDSWIRRGRIGGCAVGIRHAVTGGFGSITGTHVVDSGVHSIEADTRMLGLRDVVLGSVEADHHVDIGANAKQLFLDGCWVENAPPVVDTGRHTLEQLRAHGCRFLIGNDGAGFRGRYNHVDLASTMVADSDGSTVELFEFDPGRVTGNSLKLAGTTKWRNRGSTNALSGIQGGQQGNDGLAISHPMSVHRSFVDEPVEGGMASTTLDLPDDQSDADYGVMVSPGWDTSYCVAAKRRDGFDVEFGTPAPSGGATVDCWVYRTN